MGLQVRGPAGGTGRGLPHSDTTRSQGPRGGHHTTGPLPGGAQRRRQEVRLLSIASGCICKWCRCEKALEYLNLDFVKIKIFITYISVIVIPSREKDVHLEN